MTILERYLDIDIDIDLFSHGRGRLYPKAER